MDDATGDSELVFEDDHADGAQPPPPPLEAIAAILLDVVYIWMHGHDV